MYVKSIERVQLDNRESTHDELALEEPLEIRLSWGPFSKRMRKSVAITMRTPGDDEELAVGFLFTEAVIRLRREIESLHPCGPRTGAHGGQNILRVELDPHAKPQHLDLERNFYMTSSCGICGKASLEALATRVSCPLPMDGRRWKSDVIYSLPTLLRNAQSVFEKTGGLHAAGLFNSQGKLILLREDVGRHNAVDKIIGHEFLHEKLPLDDRLLVVSGRASFEIMQKALAAGIPIVAAVSAPSSLAVELALKFNMTLLGFLRDGRFNIYSHGWRVV